MKTTFTVFNLFLVPQGCPLRYHLPFRLSFPAYPSRPVSYTHLDVYKRQVSGRYPGGGRARTEQDGVPVLHAGFLHHIGAVQQTVQPGLGVGVAQSVLGLYLPGEE